MDNMTVDIEKRDFLKKAFKTGIVLVGGTSYILCNMGCTTTPSNPNATEIPGAKNYDIILNSEMSLNKVGGFIRKTLGTTNVMIVRTDLEEFKTISPICTHEGVDLADPVNEVLTCPRHGGQFSVNKNTFGNVLKSPPKVGANIYSTSYDKNTGVITIKV